MIRDRRRPVVVLIAGAATIVLAVALLAGGAPAPISPHGGPAAPLGANPPGGAATGGVTSDAPGKGWSIRNAEKHDVSKPLRTVKAVITPGGVDPDMEEPKVIAGHAGGRTAHVPDPALQPAGAVASTSVSAPVQNFDGTNNRNGVLPPDTNGDVGPNHYVQWVNLSLAVYSKTGTLLYGPTNGNTLWSGFGGVCETSNNGDPIALYDPLADRWMVSQFALPGGANGYHQCIAVSQTPDPTGAWYRYDFLYSATKMNDYPHFGVWPDGYYMSTNQFTGGTSWGGQGVAVFERSKMLLGQAARMVSFDLFGVDQNLGGMLPSDLDGPAPPNGAPNAFMELDDNAWGYSPDQLQIWNFHVDWTNTANSTFTKAVALPTTSFDTNLCGGARNCIPQAGTAQGLDALADRLMYRLQYRNFGDHQSIVVDDTVDVNGADHAGVRWYELRNTGSGWSIFQQGTFAPDSNQRWMSSAAMDGNGAIALGYSVSSSSMYPAIRYTGRVATDPLNTLPQGEGTIINGTGAQTHTAARWGDYSMLAVDPVDDCTFWYTNEYLTTTGSAPWRTRIASFTLPDCGGGPPTTGSVSGKVTDSSTSAAISGATVTISGGTPSTTTDASGNYAFAGLAPGPYNVAASKSGYTSSASMPVTVTAGLTTTQNIALVPLPPTTGNITGKVTNASGGAAISGATLTISGGPPTTTNSSGNYTFAGLAPGPYTVTASMAGFTASPATPVTVTAGVTTTQNFALSALPTLSTGFKFGTTASAVTSSAGDNNGYQSGAANLFSFNSVVATDTSSGTGSSQSCTSSLRDKENVSGYSFALPGTAAVKGITVQIRGRASSTSSTPKFCVLLSWNGGTSWTAGKLTPTLGTTLTTYTLGSATDLWGRTWTAADFGSNFRVRIVDLANSTSRTFYCDGVSVQLTYQ